MFDMEHISSNKRVNNRIFKSIEMELSKRVFEVFLSLFF